MSGQWNAHDAVFRRVLGEPANAASQLRAVLPEAVVDRLDVSRLARVSGSFVDATLRWRHSDLLFTVPLQGREALVYVVMEHQSSQDPLMPLRMLRYVVRVWDRYLGDHPQVTRLPRYIELVGEAPADELYKLFATMGPEAEEAYVTTAEMLRAEGEARGRAEGEARGRAESLMQLLTLKFGPLPVAARGVLHSASIEQLETWTARVLTEDTLDHVLS